MKNGNSNFAPFIAIVVYLLTTYTMLSKLEDITTTEQKHLILSLILTVVIIISTEVYYRLLLNDKSFITYTIPLAIIVLSFAIVYIIDAYYLVYCKGSPISDALIYTSVFTTTYIIYTVVQKYNSV